MSRDLWKLDGNKMLWHMDRVLAWERGERIPPVLVDIGATKVCNANCVYCYGHYQKMDNKSIIPKDILIQLFKDAPRIGVRSLTLTGDGEPTLNPAMWNACKEGKKAGLDIGIATNGIALDMQKIDNLLMTTVWVRFNLSAGTREGYKRVHRVDQFDTVVKNVNTMVGHRNLYGSKTTIGLQMVLVPECLDEIIPLAKLAVELQVDYFVIKQFSDPLDSTIFSSGLNHTEFLKKAKTKLMLAENLSNEVTTIIPKYQIMGLENRRAYPYCIDCPFIFQISGNGKCYPCGYLFNRDEYCYGDLYKQSLPEIINSERYWDIIETIKNTPTAELCPDGCCRHDACNLWLTNYMNKPDHINFI